MLKSFHSHFFMAFPKINPKQPFPSLEEKILAFWEKEKIFEKSLAQDSPAGEFKFFDGPPFATGLPHYGHILQGVIKDLIPRFKTMRGYHVPRVWGWDCHGLPVENLIEKDLGLKSKQEIEKFGIAEFNEKCRESVLKFAGEWKKTVKRMGRWIDMKHAYKTMDLEFMDSVWWVFGELWKKGLIYEGLKPMHVCPHCETPLSNFEVGLNYRDVTDLSATAKFELEDEPGTYLLAWTTTPWTLPGNVALAVNPEVEYVKFEKDGQLFIASKDLAASILSNAKKLPTKTPTLKNENVELRPREITDAKDCYEIWRNAPDSFFKWLIPDRPKNFEETEKFYRESGKDLGDFTWSIFVDDKFAGSIAREANGNLGYWLNPELQKRGLMSVSIKLVCDWLSENGINIISIPILPDNTASQRVAQKNGFELARKEIYKKKEVVVYEKTKSKVLETKKGSELVGKTYKPLFDYYPNLVNPRDISGVNGDSKDDHEVIPGMYFITFNTENSTPTFKDEKLQDTCAKAFHEVAEKNNYKIYELAVMPNHVHLVVEIEEGGESLPKTLQQIKWFSSCKLKTNPLTPQISGGLTTRVDKKTGEEFTKLWRKGYDKKFIYSEDEYAKISDYIHQNPEKKNLPAQKYDWLKIFDDVNQPVKFPEQKPQGFRIVAADFVTTDEGTGIVHIAPAFGEDDYELAKKENLPIIQNVSLDGKFTDEVTDFAGIEVKPKDDPTKTDRKIVEFLGDKIFASENYKHSYPFCWRCESPLLNYATSSWFVAVEKIKKDLLAGNEKINWVPSHIKNGRFGKWLEGARDWAISRNRFWGAPLPIWRCEKCGEMKCVSSRDELEKLSGKKVDDLHKHFVDEISWKCDCGAKMKRVSEVLDCWFESGSMPFASQYAVSSNQSAEKNKKTSANCQLKTENCTADFIAEAQDQTRGWFYTLHVLATAIQNKPAFSNCVCSGLVLAEDGEKMSKSKQNFPPPAKIFDEFGADAMRLYLMQSQVTHAEDLRFSERGVEETLRSVLLPLWNTFYFFTTYANADGWQPTDLPAELSNPLDRWILSELNILIREMTDSLEKYEIQKAVAPLAAFLDGLTNWYVRRSRRRFWRQVRRSPKGEGGKSENDSDKNEAYATLFEVLKTVAKLLAPITPFLAEKIWKDLTGEKSVHLEKWSETDKSRIDENLSAEVEVTRKIISLGLKIRANEKIKVRQPLEKATIALSNSLTSHFSGGDGEL
ncbi:MAG: GNAT family N-acetyltransferase, partial [Patescibacteria group bacterium]